MTLHLLFIAVAVGAPALKAPTPLDVGLVGSWRLETKVILGKVEQVPPDKEFVHIFEADGRCLNDRGKERPSFHFNYAIDATASPMTIDMLSKPFGSAKPMRGIFKIEADTLIICQATTPDGDRPTTFESTKDPPRWLYLYKRVKEKD